MATVDSDKKFIFAIAGNPNCGKSALFNNLTGIRQKTGNWPGVTVDRKEGYFKLDGHRATLVDMPGIYSLDATSLDEQVSQDYLLSREADLVINVLDASNLERNLYLTVQLLEMGIPVVIALNMMDVARKRGIQINTQRLSEEIGCPVVSVVAIHNEGIDALKSAVLDVVSGQQMGGFHLAQDEIVEQAVADLATTLTADNKNRHWLALKLIENDETIKVSLNEDQKNKLTHWRQFIRDRGGEDAELLIADTRFTHAHQLAQSVLKVKGRFSKTLSDRIDVFVLGRWSGIPIFLLMMYLMFLFSINLGGAFIDFFDQSANAIFVEEVKVILTNLAAPHWLVVTLADGIGGGIQIVATFIPIIAALYLFLSMMEDSGYMARAAFVMDRFMRAIGLPGKAFVPLIVGFGCNVPAIMATRTLESDRERKLTILMNPFMSCGARLPVYALFAAAFFPLTGQNVVFALYLIGITVAIITGLLMKKTLLPGDSSGFMMELPPYHVPTLKGVLLRSWDRVQTFVKEAGQIIIVMVLALNLLNSVGTDGSFGNEDTDHSILSETSRHLTPVFAPMGIREDNWPAVLGIISGVLAKEVVVGTLDNLYTHLGADPLIDESRQFDLWQSISKAFSTIPENLTALTESLFDPLGLDVGDIQDQAEAAQEQSIGHGVFGAMHTRFDGKVGAFAYLLFVLLYFPCVATIGAIKREAGKGWAAFVAFWTTFIAYVVSVGFYQIATFTQHPQSSSIWILALLSSFGVIIVLLKNWGLREKRDRTDGVSLGS